MKKLIYSKKYPKQKRNTYLSEDFKELMHRETENEFWARQFKDKYRHKVLFSDDRHTLREDHIRACVRFALKKEIDIEIFKGTEYICVNLSFDGLIDITEIMESIAFADRVISVSHIEDKDMTLSLTYQTHNIVFFKKRNTAQE